MRQCRSPAPCRFPDTRKGADMAARATILRAVLVGWARRPTSRCRRQSAGCGYIPANHRGRRACCCTRLTRTGFMTIRRISRPVSTPLCKPTERRINPAGKRCYARLRRLLRNRNSQIIMLILKGDLPSGAFVQREVGVCRPHRTAPLALAGESAANPDAALPRAGVFTVPPGARRFHDRRCARLGRRIGAARCGAR
jgi:hypothetical protein